MARPRTERTPLSFDRATGFAAELARIPFLPGQEEAVARRIVDELRALGFDEARTGRAALRGVPATPVPAVA